MFAEINRSESGNLPARPITIGENAFQGKIDRPQGFDTHQFLWVVKGSGRFWASGETRALEQGHGLFTRANVRHGYESAGGQFHTMWVTFTGAEALLDAYGVGDWMFFAAPDFLSSSTEQLERLCQNAATAMVRSAHTYTWAVELLEALFPRGETLRERVNRFLEQEYARALSLEEIAQSVGMSRFALCHAYAAEAGTTVMNALNQIRVQKAKRFLRYTASQISQIAGCAALRAPATLQKSFERGRAFLPASTAPDLGAKMDVDNRIFSWNCCKVHEVLV